MAGLKARPRVVKGRCGQCAHFDVCGGNTRVRAMQLTGDPWEEDPGCYLSDAEIGADGDATPERRVVLKPYSDWRYKSQGAAARHIPIVPAASETADHTAAQEA